MNDERLAELKEKYKNRDLFEELKWGIYWDHSGYTHKQDGEFLNWLCLMAYKALKEKPTGEWLEVYPYVYRCSVCKTWDYYDYQEETCPNYCPNCGAKMKGGDNE